MFTSYPLTHLPLLTLSLTKSPSLTHLGSAIRGVPGGVGEVPIAAKCLPQYGVVGLLSNRPLPCSMERRQVVTHDGNDTILRVRMVWNTEGK